MALEAILIGFILWFVIRYGAAGFYTVNPDQRAVITSFGRARRLGEMTTAEDAITENLRPEERERYAYPILKVVQPGGPYWKWPWQKVHKVSVATQTVSMAFDPDNQDANQHGTVLEAVTKDQLNTGLTGQIRFRVCERNLYGFLFGVKDPYSHVMGYFVSVLRDRISNFEAPPSLQPPENAADMVAANAGISINDLRKNLRVLNDHMEKECETAAARYGVEFDASLITGIDPPTEVESALAAINTAHNQVFADVSIAQASADQKIVQSRRAVEIETLRAQAEVEPLRMQAAQLVELKNNGGEDALAAYVRNVNLGVIEKADKIVLEMKK